MHATSAGCRPSYLLVVMAVVGVAAARVARLDVGRARALVFTDATRNSLVVLHLPAAYAVTPGSWSPRPWVELVGMLVYIRLVPRLIPVSASARTGMPSAT